MRRKNVFKESVQERIFIENDCSSKKAWIYKLYGYAFSRTYTTYFVFYSLKIKKKDGSIYSKHRRYRFRKKSEPFLQVYETNIHIMLLFKNF